VPLPPPSPGLLSQCNYKYGAGNGVDPKNFKSRPVATDLLNKLPQTFTDIQKNEAVARVLLFGSPGSGKTSILGYIYTRLQARYPDVPVYFVRSTEFNLQKNRIIEEIGEVPECVVILDDAHNWYADENFFGLFKSTHRILLAGANYVVPSAHPLSPVDFQVKCNIARAVV
jgi:replication-associated recombination protein RarA